MISFDVYNKSFSNLENIDSNSWVYFETKTLRLRNKRNEEIAQEVLVPQVYSKPCKLVRFIYWFFQRFLKKHLTTANDLVLAVETASKILPSTPDENDLLVRVANASKNILTRLNRKHPELSIQLAKNQATGERIVERHNAQVLHCHMVDLCQNKNLGIKGLEVAFSMDWEKDDPLLFEPTYLNDLIQQEKLHPDLKNKYISSRNINIFVNFICNLMENGQIKDHYRKVLSKENTDRLRQMMLAIMNLLNAKRTEPHFEETYASVVLQICLALDNCSNGINTNVEAVFMGLALPKEGNIGYRIRLALQIMRDTIFRKGIQACISKSPEAMEHEAASVSYYYRNISKNFGLPLSVTDLDVRFQDYAMRDQEDQISRLFFEQYTPVSIVRNIFEIIYNPYDSTIPTKAFTDWVETRYTLEARYDLLAEDGRYKPDCLVQLLQELEVIN